MDKGLLYAILVDFLGGKTEVVTKKENPNELKEVNIVSFLGKEYYFGLQNSGSFKFVAADQQTEDFKMITKFIQDNKK